MTEIDRRDFLISSGLALALAGCGEPRPGDRSRPAATEDPGAFNEGWNHGDPPWKPHPNPHVRFDPTYVAILHLDFSSEGLRARRIHFPSVRSRLGKNDWDSNRDKIVLFIRHLNGEKVQDLGDFSEYPGLMNFAFDRAHHVIIYVKNKNVDYHEQNPIWFGKNLLGKVYGVDKASKNESFFMAARKPGLGISSGSSNLVYVENHYQVGNGNGTGHRPIGRTEKFAYALKINATIASVGELAIKVPLLIDPDTGNMGEGQPSPI